MGGSKVEALERQVEALVEAARGEGGTRGEADARSVSAGDGGAATPGTVEAGSSGAGFGHEGGSGAGDGGADAAQSTTLQPTTAERVDGDTPGPGSTASRVIEGVEVSAAQIDALFRL